MKQAETNGYVNHAEKSKGFQLPEFEGRPVVYICSRYRGDTDRNLDLARRYCRMAVHMGVIPIAPHLLFPQFMSEEAERDLAIMMDLILITKCDELWVCGPTSEGMQTEIAYARKQSMKIQYFTEEDIDV